MQCVLCRRRLATIYNEMGVRGIRELTDIFSTVNSAGLPRNARNGLNQNIPISGRNYTLPVIPSPLLTLDHA